MATSKERGAINTAFLTCKLPAWAGVRQDIVGSDINGFPVKPTNFTTSRFSSSASSGGVGTLPESTVPPAAAASLVSSYSSHHVDLVESMAATVLQLTSKIDGLTEKVSQLEQTVGVVYATLADPEAMDEEEEEVQ